MKRLLIILLILIVVVGSGVAMYVLLTPKTYSVAEDPDVETLTVGTDTIIASVNVAGRLEAIDTASANFEITGQVAEILVEEGDLVNEGDLLATLETVELEEALALAEIELERATAQLNKLQQPVSQADIDSAKATIDSARANVEALFEDPSEADISAAEIALDSARANLQRLLKGPNTDSITVASANLRKAELFLKQAQDAYNEVAYDSRSASIQGLSLEQATIDYETALANYNLAIQNADSADILAAQVQIANAEANLDRLQQGPTEAQVLGAQAQLVQAESTLQKLLEGPSEADLTIAEAAVESAQINVERAKRNLEKTNLYSPINATVTGVNIKEGEVPSPPAAINLADISSFKLNVEIDEIDINRIKTGQPVIITLDSLPDEVYEGIVDTIAVAPVAGAAGGIVAYPVTILIDAQDAPFKIGMNVTADIETDRLEDVVVVENRAIQIDRETGKAYVEKVEDDTTIIRTEVTLGQRGSTVSEIVEGVEEGDIIAIRQTSRRDQLRQSLSGGPDN